jgi:hypothetical protein
MPVPDRILAALITLPTFQHPRVSWPHNEMTRQAHSPDSQTSTVKKTHAFELAAGIRFEAEVTCQRIA